LLRQSFLDLLDQELEEQRYQTYLEENTPLIPMEFIQNHGLHLDMVLRKPPLGKDYTPDFCYLSKSSIDWNCVLVELEKPSSRYFKDGGNDFHPNFSAALQQISKWRAWVESDSNKKHFTREILGPLKVPSTMASNPTYIKYVLVHGRRSELGENAQRRRLVKAQERDDFKIMSYDSLVENLSSRSLAYIGIRKNEHIEVVSKRFAGDSLFVWADSSHLKISKELKADIEASKAHYFSHSLKGGFAIEHVLPKISLAS